MVVICNNVLYSFAKKDQLIKTFGLRLVTNPLVVQFARNAGYDALWVEMEHSTFSITEASALASTAMLAGLTPIVRVPYQCGMGYVQQVLDSGAMVVVFPHVNTPAEAEAAVKMCKFPPLGKRSLWLQQAAVGLRTTPANTLADMVNLEASGVGMMIETAEAIEKIDAIAAVQGVDLLMVGCIDLSADLGVPAQFDHPSFRSALETISVAAKKHKKVFGLAGSYNNPEFQDWVINTLGVRLFLCNVDSNILSVGAIECIEKIKSIDGTLPN